MMQLKVGNSRLFILGGYSFAILAAIILILIKPNQERFSQSIALDDWSIIESDKLGSEDESIEGRKHNQDAAHGLAMEIYAIPNSSGDTLTITNKYLGSKLKPKEVTVIEDSKLGSYSLMTKDNRVHLNTCIHADGRTAATAKEFSELANSNLASRLFPWVLGLKDLRDWRCLWVNLSVSIDDLPQSEAEKLLKQKLFTLLP